MKKFLLRFLCIFCAAVISLSFLSSGVMSPAIADEPIGKMSSVYGYILNDYIIDYSVLSTNENGVVTDSSGELSNPGGVVYGDVISFDSGCPYLVIFLENKSTRTAACHIWRYNDETETASRVAAIEKNIDDIPDYRFGELHLAWDGDRKYITYKEYENYELVSEDYYTVINGEAFMLLNDPQNAQSTGILGFNSSYIHAGVDISYYNEMLDKFFSRLKDASSDSVTYPDISGRISGADRNNLTKVLMRASLYPDFDMARYQTRAEYNEALAYTSSSARFKALTSLYELGDGIYYALYDTDFTKYNYAILRKSDEAENGYQLLKSRVDAIPLADRELKQMKIKYMQSSLLYDESETSLRLVKNPPPTEAPTPSCMPITVKIGDETITVPITPAQTSAPQKPHVFDIEKRFDDRIKLPAVCIGGGIAAALLTILFVYLFSGDDH